MGPRSDAPHDEWCGATAQAPIMPPGGDGAQLVSCRAGALQQPIGQRALAVVDVRDNREIANVRLVHSA